MMRPSRPVATLGREDRTVAMLYGALGVKARERTRRPKQPVKGAILGVFLGVSLQTLLEKARNLVTMRLSDESVDEASAPFQHELGLGQ